MVQVQAGRLVRVQVQPLFIYFIILYSFCLYLLCFSWYNCHVMKKKAHNQSKRITNRRARHDYELGDGLVVGVQLTGAETKALRLGHGQLRGAYVTVKDSELWLINATINGGPGLPISDSDQT